ncbi:hypothetical protein H5410_058374 [Solanum commersonii]|uniref:Uncharacterized protein n=1 Tax=Solanum commersonii TaxID=4109 RepID=A0A9J5WTC6_SOLCO|nr:hypothetical protein H5410_058374 [Solanum commersonii]
MGYGGILKQINPHDKREYDSISLGRNGAMLSKVSATKIRYLRGEKNLGRYSEYLLNGLYFLVNHTRLRKYYETFDKHGVEFQHLPGINTGENIIHIEDWGISSSERQIGLNNVKISFTYWDYIRAFDKAYIYNNDERHKHTWLIRRRAKSNDFRLPEEVKKTLLSNLNHYAKSISIAWRASEDICRPDKLKKKNVDILKSREALLAKLKDKV